MEEIQKAYEKWVHAMKYETPSKIFDAKHDLVQLIRSHYDDPNDRNKLYDRLLEAAVEELDREEAH